MNKKTIFIISEIFILVFISLFFFCNQNPGAEADFEKQQSFANALLEKELYPQAIDAYKMLLLSPNINDKIRANVLFRMASVYADQMKDPQNALALFLKVREFYPQSEMAPDASKKIVECLEKMNRSVDAKNETSRLSSLNPDDGAKTGNPVARIEGRNITLSEIEIADGYLEKSMDKRKEQVRRFVAFELLYQSALRKGYDRQPDLQKQMKMLERNFLVNKVLGEELSQIPIDSSMAQTYFKAHQDKYTDSTANKPKGRVPSFAEVKTRVLNDMKTEKERQAYQNLMDRLLRAENVKILDDQIR
jgi:tetratricopeptide (TPR) repeat protein